MLVMTRRFRVGCGKPIMPVHTCHPASRCQGLSRLTENPAYLSRKHKGGSGSREAYISTSQQVADAVHGSAGVQLAALILGVILITIAGALFAERGTIVTVFILCYALTSFLGGYVSGGFYSRAEGKVRPADTTLRNMRS